MARVLGEEELDLALQVVAVVVGDPIITRRVDAIAEELEHGSFATHLGHGLGLGVLVDDRQKIVEIVVRQIQPVPLRIRPDLLAGQARQA
jgi:hypothetical protein